MKVAFISLGCAKNLVNTEQMMALCRDAGHTLLKVPAGADAVVINTCGFIDSAKEEAIDTILSVAALKAEGQVGKILVTGCLTQRYQQEILAELPEVDGIMGTGSYGEIVPALSEMMAGGTPRRFADIHGMIDEFDRVLTTPGHYAYLRIAEGCDNRCAYCVIPSLRGKYRSRRMEDVLAEAKRLADTGVKECIVIAQDITRYGIDLYGEKKLAALLRELCKLDFRWIRLHYLYPDEITEELIDTIAEEPKIVKYLDIPIQHCNDKVLRAMNRRGDKAELLALFRELRARIPGLVLRTSLITGLPGEGEKEFEALCDFLREYKLERVGAFAFSPEEGTRAARMEYPDAEVARQRADVVEEIQSRIMDEWNESMMGKKLQVLCEGYDADEECWYGRTFADSPDIDGRILFDSEEELTPGDFVTVEVTDACDGELIGVMEDAENDDCE